MLYLFLLTFNENLLNSAIEHILYVLMLLLNAVYLFRKITKLFFTYVTVFKYDSFTLYRLLFLEGILRKFPGTYLKFDLKGIELGLLET